MPSTITPVPGPMQTPSMSSLFSWFLLPTSPCLSLSSDSFSRSRQPSYRQLWRDSASSAPPKFCRKSRRRALLPCPRIRGLDGQGFNFRGGLPSFPVEARPKLSHDLPPGEGARRVVETARVYLRTSLDGASHARLISSRGHQPTSSLAALVFVDPRCETRKPVTIFKSVSSSSKTSSQISPESRLRSPYSMIGSRTVLRSKWSTATSQCGLA